MTTIARCLADIDKVRRVASGYEEAYVARSRLSRLVLRATKLAQHVVGTATTSSPVPGRYPTGACEQAQAIAETCVRLEACQRAAAHASEPLDGRWRLMWDEIESHLGTLEALLRGLDCPASD